MNDAVKNESQPAGFTAAPPPPQVDGANAVDISATPAAATPHALGEGPNIAVPQDTAVKALQAVHVLVENNRAASQQLESLMAIVLDAAEVANRSASTVAATGNQLFKAADTLAKNNRSSNIQAKLVLALTGTVLVGAAVAFSFMTMQLNEKVEQVDAMLLAVGKRAVDLKARLEAMDDINATLAELSLKQDNTQSVQMSIEDKLARVAEQTRYPESTKNNKPAPVPATPVTAAPAPAQPAAKKTDGKADAKTESKGDAKTDVKASPKAEAKPANKAESKANTNTKAEVDKKAAENTKPAVNDQLNQQLSGLDALLQQQSKAVQELSQQLSSVKGAVSNVDSLKKDVENLAALQKQRNQEAAQAAIAAADARRDRELKERELKEREQKDRELLKARDALRERELLREREAMRDREIQREREAAQARAAATPVEPAPVAKEKPKNATFVKYSREQANTKSDSQDNLPSYTKPSETKQQ